MIKKGHPYLFIIISFVSVILIGSILLVMPFAMKSGKTMGYHNAIFMSSSAVCVTGLSVMKHSLSTDMTVYGKIVMVILMEIGGLSIISIAMFFFTILGGRLGISNKFLLREQLNQSNINGMFSLIKKIVIFSFAVQIIGTLINIYPIYEYVKNTSGGGIGKAIGISLFHSCASFNNAGFDIFGDEGMLVFSSQSDVISKFSIYLLNISTMLMIILGGIGVIVIIDLFENRFKWSKIRLHTKITIITSVCLYIIGALMLYALSPMKMLEAWFTSVTCRTAGFQTYNMALISEKPIAYMIVVFLMFIGASPCSCGGGIKTTTLAVILIAIYNFAKGSKNNVFNRRINDNIVIKSFVLVNVAVISVLIVTMFVVINQTGFGFEKSLFEVVSAFSTTGLSMGITNQLSVFNKLLLSIVMLFGRLGPLTVIGVLNKKWMSNTEDRVLYPEEGVIVG